MDFVWMLWFALGFAGGYAVRGLLSHRWAVAVLVSYVAAVVAMAASAGGLDDPLYRAPVGATTSVVDAPNDRLVSCPNSPGTKVRRRHVDQLCASDDRPAPVRRVTIVDFAPPPPPRPMPMPMGGKD